MQPNQPNAHSDDMGPAVITVNFGLKARHVVAAFGLFASGIAGLGTAGWLVFPAKQSELAEVRSEVREIATKQQTVQTSVDALTAAVERLTGTVDDLVKVSGQRPKVRPAKPIPKAKFPWE
jgi:hypothetical protein